MTSDPLSTRAARLLAAIRWVDEWLPSGATEEYSDEFAYERADVLKALREGVEVLTAAEAERDEAVRHYGHACAAVDHAVTALKTVVHTIGGTVEGAPTHRGNYLQRLRQLLEAEAERDRRQEVTTAQTIKLTELGDENAALFNQLTAAREALRQLVEKWHERADDYHSAEVASGNVIGEIEQCADELAAAICASAVSQETP